LVCTATNATTNQITCTQTVRLSINDPIRFYGTVFGGIVAGAVYYVSSIVDPTNFTIALDPDGLPFSLTTASGTMIADVPEPIDAIYASSFTDQYLGRRPTDINVDGGEFIGPYEGYAPEELVNGSEYDTLDFRVYTRPGADWTGRGHGFDIGSYNYVYQGVALDWSNLIQNPVNIEVSNATTDSDLTPDVDYVVDWENQTVTAIPGGGITNGDVINIAAYEMGGGNQLFRGNYTGPEAGNSVIIPVDASEIYQLVLFANGQNVSGATWVPYINSVPWDYQNSYVQKTVVNNSGSYYRALQLVPPGILLNNILYWAEFTPTTESLVTLPATYGTGDGISLTAIGISTVVAGKFVIDRTYTIATVGTTNFVAIGAANNTVGTVFTATGNGTGTGTASKTWVEGDTGGSTDAITVSHTHTATTSSTDSGHTHAISPAAWTTGGGKVEGNSFSFGGTVSATQSSTANITSTTTVASAGSSATNANYQPYITVYMWKRTA
jgi:hypothetical protein